MPKAIDENRVFEVTATLFVRHGYAGTKTKEIAEAAGVNADSILTRIMQATKSLQTLV